MCLDNMDQMLDPSGPLPSFFFEIPVVSCFIFQTGCALPLHKGKMSGTQKLKQAIETER